MNWEREREKNIFDDGTVSREVLRERNIFDDGTVSREVLDAFLLK